MIVLATPHTQYTMVGREQDNCRKTIWEKQELEITEWSLIQSKYHVTLDRNNKAYFLALDFDPWLANLDSPGKFSLICFLPWLMVSSSWKISLSIILHKVISEMVLRGYA